MPVIRKFSQEEKGKQVAMENFPGNCSRNMIGRGQSDINSIKRFFGVSSCLDDHFDKNSGNFSQELTQSMVSAYHKLKAIFPPKEDSLIYATPSTPQMPFEHINVGLTGDCHHECDIEAMSASSSSKQVLKLWSKKRFPKTKSYKSTSRRVFRPKPVHLSRENLIMDHALNSRLAKGEEFCFFHRSGLASVTVKVASQTASSCGSKNPSSDQSMGSTGFDEPIIVTEELTEVQDHGLNDKHEFSDNVSCLSVEKQQSTYPLTEQASNDQVMEVVSFTTPGGAQKKKKRSRRQFVHRGINLLPPRPRKNNKTEQRKGFGRKLACRIIGRNGCSTDRMPTRMVTPCKRARQPITIELVIDPTLMQAFKRRKWLLGYD